MSFVAQSLTFNGTSQYLDLAQALTNGWADCTISFWIRYSGAGWSGSQRAILLRNASNQRQVAVNALARGGLGEMQFGFGNGTTLFSAYLPDNTLSARYFQHVVIVKSGSTLTGYVDDRVVALQNVGAIPAAVGSSTAAVTIGGPGNFWLGQLSNLAMWTSASGAGGAFTRDQVHSLWGRGYGAVDYRTIAGIPTAKFYLPLDGNATELIVPITVGGVVGSADTHVPNAHLETDTFFDRKQTLFFSGHKTQTFETEPWVTGGTYCHTPGVERLLDGSWFITYSRGSSHAADDHQGFFIRSFDDGISIPVSGRTWPLDTDHTDNLERQIPHGVLNGGGKRNFTPTLIPTLGGVQGRLFVVFNEGSSGGGVRKTQLMYTDDPQSLVPTWSTPYEIVGRGTEWTSVGRSRIRVRRSDGSLVLGYYGHDVGEVEYFVAMMRSTDGGLTWAHWTNVMSSGFDSNLQEPYFDYVSDDSDEALCLIRIDAGHETFLAPEGGSLGDPIGGVIVQCKSIDHFQTWTSHQFACWGQRNPCWFRRPSDGLIVLSTCPGQIISTPLGNADPGFFPVLRFSRDAAFPFTFTADNTVIDDPACDSASMQGDFILTDADRIAFMYSREIAGKNVARMWAGLIDEDFIESKSPAPIPVVPSLAGARLQISKRSFLGNCVSRPKSEIAIEARTINALVVKR
jgi:hypothetical protein